MKTPNKKFTKKEAIAFIKNKLQSDDRWAIRALNTIFKNQTADEKLSAEAKYSNGIGFSGVDAKFLTSLALQVADRGTLSMKQMAWLKRKIGKYAKQLLSVTNMEKLKTLIEESHV